MQERPLLAQRACHGRPNTGCAASHATCSNAICFREMRWGESNQASLLFSSFNQCCCACQPHSSQGMYQFVFLSGCPPEHRSFHDGGENCFSAFGMLLLRDFISDAKPFHMNSGQVAMVVGIEGMDRASSPSSEWSPFG